MKPQKMKLKLLLISIIILTTSLIINFLLNISSFEEVFKSSLVSRYIFINRNLTKKIETAVNLGKPLYKFNGIDVFFDEILSKERDITNVFISSAEGQVYYSHNKTYLDKYIIDEIIPKIEGGKIKVSNINGRYYICSAIYKDNNKIEGYTFIEFEKQVINNKITVMIKENIDILSTNLFISIIFLIIFISFLKEAGDEKITKFNKKRNFFFIFIVFISSQLVYSYTNIKYFEKIYINLLDTNIDYFSKSLNNEINYYTDLGLSIGRLKGFEKYLANELLEFSEAEAIYITDTESKILYSANLEGLTTGAYEIESRILEFEKFNNKYYRNYVIRNTNYNANIYIHLNEKLINKKIIELTLDTLTMLIISIIISYQMLLFTTLKKVTESLFNQEEVIEHEKVIIQLMSFIFYFGEMLTISFMPLLVEKILMDSPVEFLGLSTNTLIGLPIAFYMFGSALSVLLIGFLSNKIPVKKIFAWCSIFLLVGGIGSAVSINILSLTVCRFISGIGFGGITINATNMILKRFKRGEVAIGFGFWASGYGAASICSLPIGGIIVYRFGFLTALVTSSVVAGLLFLFIIFFIHSTPISKEERERPKIKFKETMNIFSDREVFANFFFRLVPFHIVYVGIFQFIMPLFMNKEGISQADIGRILTIFGLVYLLMPIVSKLVARFKNDRIFIAIGSLIIGIFLLIIKFSAGVIGFILIITGFSLGSMIADAAEESFITSTKKAKEMGEAKFMSIYNSYERFIMVVSPLICSFFIAVFGFSNGIFMIGLLIIISSIIYLVISKKSTVTN